MSVYKTLIFLLITSLGCGRESDSENSRGIEVAQQEMVETLFSNEVTLLEVDVYYESGSRPFDGNLGILGKQTWDITEDSYSELFSEFSTRNFSIPKDISQMTEISANNKNSWSITELEALGENVASNFRPSSNKVQLSVIFVSGQLEDKPNVIGVHLTGRPFSFIFKDIVDSIPGSTTQKKYIEQSIVVHELGHTVGVVNNGVPLSQNHEDSSHPKHTNNDQGVMYWAVNNSNNIGDFASDALGASRTQLFGSQTLQDAQNY